ncbi:MAG: hypothetical protein IJJ80_01005 [Clostridia bacterium]|nr:hypothetical protein [Clostridia bacterium]
MSNKQAKGKKPAPSVRSSAPGTALRYLLGILLIALGTAGVLSLVASGGSYVLTVVRSNLRGLGGFLNPALPFLLIWLGAALAVSCYHRVSFRAPVFALLLYLNILALLTCWTTVTTQGSPSLMDYIKTYNSQHFTSRSFASASFPAYVQQLFNWGYRMDSLAAGGALSQVFAYPAYILFGSIGSRLLEIVLTLACLFAFLHIRPTRLIRGASDLLERWRTKRYENHPKTARPEPAGPEISPIQEQRQEYTSPTNPYTNVRWIYDEPQEEAAPAVPVEENPFMRPGTDAPQEAAPVQTGPFVPLNTQNDLYHEPFVLHPDGAYDVMEEPLHPVRQKPVPPADDLLPWEEEKPARRRPAVQPVEQAAPSVPAPEVPARDTKRTAQDNRRPVSQSTEPEAEETTEENLFAPPRKRKPETQAAETKTAPAPAARPKTETAKENKNTDDPDDAGMSEWQIQLQALQKNLNKTREERRQLESGKAKPVHTDPVDLLKLDHVPIKPVAEPKSGGRLDNTPEVPKTQNMVVHNGPYVPPPMNFLSLPKAVNPADSAQDDAYRAAQIERTLKTFNVDAEVREITHGPAITRFAVKLAEGVKVKQVTSVLDNLMLEMGTDRLRLETPIPGTSYIGIEAPNNKVGAVTLREVLDSPEMQNARSPLAVALGKDIAGKPIIGDLSKMPHLLIAGATGSGKSVCINSIVCSLLYRTSPKDVRLIMVDPKQVELQVYNGIPHLLIPVVCDPKKAAVALNWTVNEMLERYGKFSKQNVRNLEGYNKKMPEDERLPHIVLIIDEMADLMEVCRKDVEESIRRLAALARAAGIYLVLATQRPSVDVITGVIKNNIPSRIAFTVSSGVDSRTIIDVNGAEKLMGKGDMLYLPVGASKPMRVQGCFVTDDEVARISENIQARYRPDYNHAIQEVIERPTETGSDSGTPSEPVNDMRESEFSDLLSEAVRMAVQDGQTSISMLQRTLRIGYARAGRIIDEMTKRGIISESEGSKPRKTIITRDEYVQMMSEGLLNGNGDS